MSRIFPFAFPSLPKAERQTEGSLFVVLLSVKFIERLERGENFAEQALCPGPLPTLIFPWLSPGLENIFSWCLVLLCIITSSFPAGLCFVYEMICVSSLNIQRILILF